MMAAYRTGGHSPYVGTLAICVAAVLASALLWRENAAHSLWVGWLMYLPAAVAAGAVLLRLRKPLNWHDLIAQELASYPYADVEAWRDLQQVVREEGFIPASVFIGWLDKELKAGMNPLRREFRFTSRESGEAGKREQP